MGQKQSRLAALWETLDLESTALSLDDVDTIFDEYDINGDGQLSVDEAKVFLRDYLSKRDVLAGREERLDELIAMLDVDGNGFITREEMLADRVPLVEKMDEEEARVALAASYELKAVSDTSMGIINIKQGAPGLFQADLSNTHNFDDPDFSNIAKKLSAHQKPPNLDIVVIAVGSESDVQPLWHMARALVRRGNRVLVATQHIRHFDSLLLPSHDPQAQNLAGLELMTNIDFVGLRTYEPRDLGSFFAECFQACCTKELGGKPFFCRTIVASYECMIHVHLAERFAIPVHLVSATPLRVSSVHELPHPLCAMDEETRRHPSIVPFSYQAVDQEMQKAFLKPINSFRLRLMHLSEVKDVYFGLVLQNQVPITFLIPERLYDEPALHPDHVSFVKLPPGALGTTPDADQELVDLYDRMEKFIVNHAAFTPVNAPPEPELGPELYKMWAQTCVSQNTLVVSDLRSRFTLRSYEAAQEMLLKTLVDRDARKSVSPDRLEKNDVDEGESDQRDKDVAVGDAAFTQLPKEVQAFLDVNQDPKHDDKSPAGIIFMSLSKARAERAFLLVVQNAAELAQVRVLVHISGSLDPVKLERQITQRLLPGLDEPDELPEPLKESKELLVWEGDLRHAVMLELDDVSAYVSHGESVDVNLGVAKGKPVGCLPVDGDQFFWANRGVDMYEQYAKEYAANPDIETDAPDLKALAPIAINKVSPELLANMFTALMRPGNSAMALALKSDLVGGRSWIDDSLKAIEDGLPVDLGCEIDPCQPAVWQCDECRLRLCVTADLVLHGDIQYGFMRHSRRGLHAKEWNLNGDSLESQLQSQAVCLFVKALDRWKRTERQTTEKNLRKHSDLDDKILDGVYNVTSKTGAALVTTAEGASALSEMGATVISKVLGSQEETQLDPSDTGEGFKKGGVALVRGVVDGVTGVVVHPWRAIRAARTNDKTVAGNAGSVALAATQGIFGLVCHPLRGLLNMNTSILKGMVASGDRALLGTLAQLGSLPGATAKVTALEVADLKSKIERHERLKQVVEPVLVQEFRSAAHHARWMGFRPKYPVVIIPSLGGSALKVQESQHYQKGDRLWLAVEKIFYGVFQSGRRNTHDPAQSVSLRTEWLQHMQLNRDPQCSDPPGIVVTAFNNRAGIAALENLMCPSLIDSNGAIWTEALQQLRAMGYKDGQNLFGAPYDWRLPPSELIKRGLVDDSNERNYYEYLKYVCEIAVKTNNGMKVMLCSHSMGCNVAVYFMSWVNRTNPDWINKYIHTFVPMGGPFMGAAQATMTGMLGSQRIPTLKEEDARSMMRSFGSQILLEAQGPNGAGVHHTYLRRESRVRLKNFSLVLNRASKKRTVYLKVVINGRSNRSLKTSCRQGVFSSKTEWDQNSTTEMQFKGWEREYVDDQFHVTVCSRWEKLSGWAGVTNKQKILDQGQIRTYTDPCHTLPAGIALQPLLVKKEGDAFVQEVSMNLYKGRFDKGVVGVLTFTMEWHPPPPCDKPIVGRKDRVYQSISADTLYELEGEDMKHIRLAREYHRRDPNWQEKPAADEVVPICPPRPNISRIHHIYGINLTTPIGYTWMANETVFERRHAKGTHQPSNWFVLDSYASKVLPTEPGLDQEGGVLSETSFMPQADFGGVKASGDAVVPYSSLKYPKMHWDDHLCQVTETQVPEAEHRGMLKNRHVHMALIQQVCSKPAAGYFMLRIKQARNIPEMDTYTGQADPYCVVKFRGQQFKTKVEKCTRHPVWRELFRLPLAVEDIRSKNLALTPESCVVNISVWDEDVLLGLTTRDKIGEYSIDLSKYGDSLWGKRNKIDDWLRLYRDNKAQEAHFKSLALGGAIHDEPRCGMIQVEMWFDSPNSEKEMALSELRRAIAFSEHATRGSPKLSREEAQTRLTRTIGKGAADGTAGVKLNLHLQMPVLKAQDRAAILARYPVDARSQADGTPTKFPQELKPKEEEGEQQDLAIWQISDEQLVDDVERMCPKAQGRDLDTLQVAVHVLETLPSTDVESAGDGEAKYQALLAQFKGVMQDMVKLTQDNAQHMAREQLHLVLKARGIDQVATKDYTRVGDDEECDTLKAMPYPDEHRILGTNHLAILKRRTERATGWNTIREEWADLHARALASIAETEDLRAKKIYYPDAIDVPLDKQPWHVKWPEYKPQLFTSKHILEADADGDGIKGPSKDGEVYYKTQEFKEEHRKLNLQPTTRFTTDKDGKPLNPRGRQGIAERGALYAWGPNRGLDPVVVRYWNERWEVALVPRDLKEEKDLVQKCVQIPGVLRRGLYKEVQIDESGKTIKVGESPDAMQKRALIKCFHPDDLPLVLNSQQRTSWPEVYTQDARSTDNAWIVTHLQLFVLEGAAQAVRFNQETGARWFVLCDLLQSHNRLWAAHRRMLGLVWDSINKVGGSSVDQINRGGGREMHLRVYNALSGMEHDINVVASLSKLSTSEGTRLCMQFHEEFDEPLRDFLRKRLRGREKLCKLINGVLTTKAEHDAELLHDLLNDKQVWAQLPVSTDRVSRVICMRSRHELKAIAEQYDMIWNAASGGPRKGGLLKELKDTARFVSLDQHYTHVFRLLRLRVEWAQAEEVQAQVQINVDALTQQMRALIGAESAAVPVAARVDQLVLKVAVLERRQLVTVCRAVTDSEDDYEACDTFCKLVKAKFKNHPHFAVALQCLCTPFIAMVARQLDVAVKNPLQMQDLIHLLVSHRDRPVDPSLPRGPCVLAGAVNALDKVHAGSSFFVRVTRRARFLGHLTRALLNLLRHHVPCKLSVVDQMIILEQYQRHERNEASLWNRSF